MGKSKGTSSTSIPPPGAAEQDITELLRGLFGDLGTELRGLQTPEEFEAAVEPHFALAARRGGEDIMRRGIEAAGARGLGLADSPISAPLLREQREFSEGLAAQRSQIIMGLRQQAIQNRLNLAQGLTSGISTLGGIRLGQPSTVTTQRPSALEIFTGVAGGVGGLLTGAGGLAKAGGFAALSGREFKEGVEPLSGAEEADLLRQVRRTPINRFRYKESLGLADGTAHIGPMAEEAPPGMVTMDGKAISLPDAVGTLMASNKALAREVEGLKKRLGTGGR